MHARIEITRENAFQLLALVLRSEVISLNSIAPKLHSFVSSDSQKHNTYVLDWWLHVAEFVLGEE